MKRSGSAVNKVVVIGGGHGQSAVCRGIKKIPDIDITAIVTVADDGGSTGRLRRKFHIPAMGDIRNVMISLAESETLMSTLMDYRFEDPMHTEEDVAGHNLGNLILTAMTQQCGSFLEAIRTIGRVLNVRGRIIPATSQVITLFALMEDDVIVRGEANIPNRSNRIRKVFYDVPVRGSKEAIQAIREADMIIYCIGSLYTSVIPNVIIDGIREALQESNARKILFCNAMTQPGETDGFSAEDHVRALREHGAPLDTIIVSNDPVPRELLQKYADQGSTRVILKEEEHDYRVITQSLLEFDGGLIRHNSLKIEKAVKELLEEL